MMKLAYDLRTTHISGVFRFGTSILRNLTFGQAEAGWQIYVLHWRETKDQVSRACSTRCSKVQVEFVEVVDDYRFIRDSPALRRWLVEQDIDVYYSVHYLADPDLPVPFITSVYDLIRLKHSGHSTYTDAEFRHTFGREEFQRIREIADELSMYLPPGFAPPKGKEVFHSYFLAINRHLVERCRRIITISTAVKSDIVEMLSVPEWKVSVVPGAADSGVFYPRNGQEVEAILGRTGVSAPYCLCVGLAQRHKRAEWLLESLWRNIHRLPQGAKLVIVGTPPAVGWSSGGPVRLLSAKGALVFAGRVSDDALACLYSGARALVVPSIDEGFCLPALEALCCGTEIIVPRLRSLQEVARAHAHFYAHGDGQELGELLVQAFNCQLPRRALGFVSPFSWQTSGILLSRTIADCAKSAVLAI